MSDVARIDFVAGVARWAADLRTIEGMSAATAARIAVQRQAADAKSSAQAVATQKAALRSVEDAAQESAARRAASERQLQQIILSAESDRITQVQRISARASEQIAQISALDPSGNSVQGAAAMAAVRARAARDVAAAESVQAAASVRAATSTTTMATATVAATKATRGMSGALGPLAMQLPDVATQLAAGANPATVFAQQGLQVIQQWGMIPGLLGSVASALAPLGLAVAAGAAAWAVWGNATADARGYSDGLDAQIRSLQEGLRPDMIQAQAQSIQALARASQAAHVQLSVLAGDITDTEAATITAVEQVRAEGQAHLVAARAAYVRIETERQLLAIRIEQTRVADQGPMLERLARIEREAPALLAAARAAQEDIDATAELTQRSIQQAAAKREEEAALKGHAAATREDTDEAERALRVEMERASRLRLELREIGDSDRERARDARQQEADEWSALYADLDEWQAAFSASMEEYHTQEMARIAQEEEARLEAALSATSAVGGMMGSLAELSDQYSREGFAGAKALAYGEAVVTGAAAVVSGIKAGLDVGGIAGIILAASTAVSVAADTAVQVSKIQSTQYSAYTGADIRVDGPSTGFPVQIQAHPGERIRVDDRETTRESGRRPPGDVVVAIDGRQVASAVTTAYQRDRRLAARAGLVPGRASRRTYA